MKQTMLIWLAGGVVLVGGSFFIPAQSGSLWPSLTSAGVTSLVYLIAFCGFWLPKISSPFKKRAIGITLTVMVVFSMVSAGISYEGSKRQTALLPEIRTTIETGIAESYIKKHLLKTMRAYYTEDESGKKPGLGEIFRAKFDSLITEDRLLLYEGRKTYSEDDPTRVKIFVQTVKPDSIVLVAESGYMDGGKPGFENYSGARGMYQTKGILTKEGIRYERTN